MKNMMIVSLLLGMSSLSLANSALVGTWKMQNMGCKSGVIQNASEASIDMTVSFTETLMDMKMNISANVDVKQFEQSLAQIEESKKQIEALPDSPSKTDALAQIEKSKAEIMGYIEKFKNGFSCQMRSQGSYSTSGSQILTNLKMVSSTCEGATSDEGNSVAEFSISENTLTVTSKSETETDRTCAVGDSQVTAFTRIQ